MHPYQPQEDGNEHQDKLQPFPTAAIARCLWFSTHRTKLSLKIYLRASGRPDSSREAQPDRRAAQGPDLRLRPDRSLEPGATRGRQRAVQPGPASAAHRLPSPPAPGPRRSAGSSKHGGRGPFKNPDERLGPPPPPSPSICSILTAPAASSEPSGDKGRRRGRRRPARLLPHGRPDGAPASISAPPPLAPGSAPGGRPPPHRSLPAGAAAKGRRSAGRGRPLAAGEGGAPCRWARVPAPLRALRLLPPPPAGTSAHARVATAPLRPIGRPGGTRRKASRGL